MTGVIARLLAFCLGCKCGDFATAHAAGAFLNATTFRESTEQLVDEVSASEKTLSGRTRRWGSPRQNGSTLGLCQPVKAAGQGPSGRNAHSWPVPRKQLQKKDGKEND
jgi:hypothetical protein